MFYPLTEWVVDDPRPPEVAEQEEESGNSITLLSSALI